MLSRLVMPALCGAILVGAGLFQLLLPIHVEEHHCEGNAITLTLEEGGAGHLAHECEKVAHIMLFFGAGVGATGLAVGISSGVAMARRPTVRR